MRSEKGRQLHNQSSELLESGDFLGALIKTDEAMIAYQEDSDDAGFSEILAMKVLIFNMYYDKTEYKGYLYIAKHTALLSLELAIQSTMPEQIALAHAAVGRVMDRVGEYQNAAEHFASAVELLSENPSEHSKKSVIADFKNHQASSKLLTGDLSAETDALSAIEELQISDDATPHEKGVWLSGAYMRLAHGMFKTDKDKANQYLNKAEEIINSDPGLSVRKEQVDIMRKRLGL